MQIDVVIPFAAATKERQRNLQAVVAGLRKVVNHSVNIIVERNAEEPFCKTKTMKWGANRGKADWILFLDADIAFHYQKFFDRLEGETTFAVSPFSCFVYLTEEETEQVLLGHKLKKKKEEAVYTLCAGAIAMRREVYQKCPPPEEFKGWGWEDIEWSRRLVQYGAIKYSDTAFHFWHPLASRGRSRTNKKIYRAFDKRRIFHVTSFGPKWWENPVSLIVRNSFFRASEQLNASWYYNVPPGTAEKPFDTSPKEKIIQLPERLTALAIKDKLPLPYIPFLIEEAISSIRPKPDDLIVLTNADCAVDSLFYLKCLANSPLCFFRRNVPSNYGTKFDPLQSATCQINKTGIDGFCMSYEEWKKYDWPLVFLGECYWDPLYLELMRERLQAQDDCDSLHHIAHPQRTSLDESKPSVKINKEALLYNLELGSITSIRCWPFEEVNKRWYPIEEETEGTGIAQKRDKPYLYTDSRLTMPEIARLPQFQHCPARFVKNGVGLAHQKPNYTQEKFQMEAVKWRRGMQEEMLLPYHLSYWVAKGKQEKEGRKDCIVLGYWGKDEERLLALKLVVEKLEKHHGSDFDILIVTDCNITHGFSKKAYVLKVDTNDVLISKECLWNIGGSFAIGRGSERLFFLDSDCLMLDASILYKIREGLSINPMSIGQVGKTLLDWDLKKKKVIAESSRTLWGTYCENAQKGKRAKGCFSPGLSACVSSLLFCQIGGFNVLGYPFGGDHLWMAETCFASWYYHNYASRPFFHNSLRDEAREKSKALGVHYFSEGATVFHIHHPTSGIRGYNDLEEAFKIINWNPTFFLKTNEQGLLVWKCKHLLFIQLMQAIKEGDERKPQEIARGLLI